jgi:Predicted oxidoreductases (related to aryl-alcohol dehydrogenases)
MREKYNMLEGDKEKDKVDIARRYGLAVMAYSPLAQGFLTGKYTDRNGWKVEELSRATISEDLKKRYFTDANLKILLGLKDIASELGITLSQLAIAWLLKRGEQLGVTVIPLIGASKVEHLEDNLSALNVNLRDEHMKRIEEILGKST